MKFPKVLIGCPTYKGKDYALQRYLDAIKELEYENADILLVDNSDDDSYFRKLQDMKVPVVKVKRSSDVRQTVADSRNILRQKVLEGGYDYLFSFEQDLHSPSPGALHSMLSWKKKVISGIYYKKWDLKDNQTGEIAKKDQLIPVAFAYDERNPEQMQIMSNPSVLQQIKAAGSIMKIRMAGLGCCLIHRDVLQKIKFRTEQGKNSWDDAYFFTDVYKQGFDAWADPSAEFQHDERFDPERKKIV